MAGSPGFARRPQAAADGWLLHHERARALRNAERWFGQPVSTITDFPAQRSPGDRHAYYSEGDYWWPDPADPAGPYIRRDGLSNPDRFDAHRQALIRLSLAVPALVTGWIVSKDQRYADAADRHLGAWFVDPHTKMAPHLNHAQAIIGRNQGRGIGIIDTLHLVEVALAARLLPLSRAVLAGTIDWFSQYLDWMWQSPNGADERDERNNHGSAYALQVAAFATLTGDAAKVKWARDALFNTLIPNQIARDGSQPLELARTKPFGYSLFNMDVLAALAQLTIAADQSSLWQNRAVTGGSLADAVGYMLPFIADKARWPHARDVEYWDEWPVRHAALIFAGTALRRQDMIALWQRLPADPQTPEVIRNMPVRQPLLWPGMS